MTKHTLSRIAAMFIAFVALFSYTGCKESSIINTNITPAGDSLIIEGTPVSVTAKTVYDRFNTSLTFDGIAVVHGVGVISHDPEVGKTEASIYFQVVPQQSAGYILPADDLIDSVRLVMPYIGFTYGDTANAVSNTYTAYYVTDDNKLVHGATYYNDDFRNYDGTPLGSATINNSTFRDSMSVEGKNAMPHLRIPLDKTTIVNRLKSANYGSYVDFLGSFKGLYVTATNNNNNNTIPYFRLSDDGAGTNWSKAGIVVYYHNADSPTVMRSNVFGFDQDNCAHFNRVVQDISGSKAASADTANFLFFQSRPGLAIEISTKDVKMLENRVVNKAEIIITEVESIDANKYFAPEYLYPYLMSKTAAGLDTLIPIADATFTSSGGTEVSGLNFISGAFKKVTIDGKEYRQYTVNVPREFQKALVEKREMTLHITGVSSGYIGAYRLRAGKNASNPAFNIRMNVVYSKL